MASIFMVKSTILRVSNPSFPPKSSSLYPCNKVSRVYFASASKNSVEDLSQSIKVTTKEGAEQVSETLQDAQYVATKNAEKAKSKTGETVDNLKENAQGAAQQAGEPLQDAQEKAKESAEVAGKKIGETVEGTKEWAKDTADWTVEKAKEVADKAKESAEGAWESAQDASKKITDN